jgi:hypothetical protein
MSFPFLYILNSLHLLFLVTFCQVCLPVKETAEIETGMAEKSSQDQANIRQKLVFASKNRMKISQIITDYFYLPFFLLIILCHTPSSWPPPQILRGRFFFAIFAGDACRECLKVERGRLHCCHLYQ